MKDGAGLGGAYGVTLERVKVQGGEKTKLAVATLTWVCHSERPLKVDELCHALAVEIGATDFDSENIPLINTLLDCCQGLITVDKEASTVRLIHFTVQEYLYAQPDLFSKPHSILAETCLTYLNSRQIKDLSSKPLPDCRSIPFLEYSSRYWGTHANRELSDHARTLALELLNQYEEHVSAVSLLKQVLPPILHGDIGTSPLFSGLHCASFFGIVELVTALIDARCFKINQQDCAGGTPLTWAAVNRHEGVLELLLEQEGTDPNHPGLKDMAPLVLAAFLGYEEVVKLLLEQENIDPNRPEKSDITPLACAAFMGHEGVVKLLLEREDVDPNRPDKDEMTPLAGAALNGHQTVVKLLLEQENVDPNLPDKDEMTPLARAAFMGHEGVVELLLKREDVDPNCLVEDGQTLPVWAAAAGHEDVVKLLLKREDVDPNCSNKSDLTPLGCAALRGHEGVVKLLLEHENVDPDRPDMEDITPLAWAAFMGHEGVVKLLLEREDVDPNHLDKNYQTPFRLATIAGHEGVIKLLLERKSVSPNRPDKNNPPPEPAAAKGHD